MELALPAQCNQPFGASCYEAHSGSRSLRLQLADRHGHWLLPRRNCRWTGAGTRSGFVDESLLADVQTDEVGDGRHLVHAWFGLRDALLRSRRRLGTGIHPNRVAVPLLRNIFRMAGCRTDWKRHFVECAVWKLAAHHGTAT